jgi:hypothetical protein
MRITVYFFVFYKFFLSAAFLARRLVLWAREENWRIPGHGHLAVNFLK